MHQLVRAASTALVAVALVLTAPSAVQAQAAPQKSESLTFGVQPSRRGQPDQRPWFSYDVDPGAQLSDELLVVNASTTPLTLRVVASDAYTNDGGAFDLRPSAERAVDVGSWVALGKGSVTVPARGRTVVPFTLRVPSDAVPGDHAGGVVVSLKGASTDASGDRIEVDQRVGARIYARVRGELNAAITVEPVELGWSGTWNPFGNGRADVRYVLRNTGNVRVRTSDSLVLSTPLGRTTVQRPATTDELLPGSAVVVSARQARFPAFRVSADVTARPVGLDGELPLAMPVVTASAATWAVPWALLALVLVVAGLIVAAAVARRRTRARMAAVAGGRRGRHRAPLVNRPGGAVTARNSLAPALVVGLALMAAALAPAAQAHAADAPRLGTLFVDPGRGRDDTPLEILTTGGCPAPATNVIASVFGKGFPAAGQVVVGNTDAGVSRKGSFSVVLADTMRAFAAMQPEPAVLTGTYRVVLTCRKALEPASLGDYVGVLDFSTPRAFAAKNPATRPVPVVEPAGPGSLATAPTADGTAPGAGVLPGSSAAPAGPGVAATSSSPPPSASAQGESADRGDDGSALVSWLLPAALLIGAAALLVPPLLRRRRPSPAPTS